MKFIPAWFAACAIIAGAVATAETNPGAVLGQWWTDGEDSKIQIFKSGEKYHGKIVWLKEPNYEENDPEAGKPKRDRNNPDPARQNDPMVGLNLVKDFTFDGEGSWTGGTIYDPESGKTYKCTMKLSDENTLDVRGYIGIPAFGRSTTWKRVSKHDEVKTDTTSADPGEASPGPTAGGEERKADG
jgi:uncharacterized protein (DUF2147 family)